MEFISVLLGKLLGFIYGIVNNYGLAILFFTVIVRLILLPLNIKQQKSMIKMQALSPLLSAVQEKYKNDKEKQSQETMKLYKEHDVSPFAGCLPLLIQLPILFALISVIYNPGWYLFGGDTNAWLTENGYSLADTTAKLMYAVKECGLYPYIFGIDLTAIPKFEFFDIVGSISVEWIFPLLATGATYLSGKMTQNKQQSSTSSTSGQNDAAQTGKMVQTMMPLMTLFFTFTMPVAASFYWFVSSAIQIVQTFILNKVIKVDPINTNNGGTWHERNTKKRKNG